MRNKIDYEKWTFTDEEILEGNPYSEQSLPSSALGVSTITVQVKCIDPSIVTFRRNAPMSYFYKDRQRGIYYVQSVNRVGPNRYTITATTALGLLEQMEHRGGIYTGETVGDVVRSICGDVPVKVKTNLEGIKLYGWLPYCKPPKASARDNLVQVLFAIGAYLGTDLDGYLRVEPLWDGVSNVIPPDRIYNEGQVEYGTPVSAVTVTEHQYIQGTDRTTLFEGTAVEGDVAEFDSPMHDLQAEGFTILDSGPNWARLSAGTGVLTGVAYIHATRQVTETVNEGAVENVKFISDCTLVSLVNSRAVAARMAEYYRCVSTISVPIVAEVERPGDVVSIYDPFDRKMVEACISSMDVNMSNVLRAETQALVGFKPPQPGETEYYDFREVLTGSGEWAPPEGVKSVTYVLISGAQGGKAGRKGEPGTSRSFSYTGSLFGKISIPTRGYGPGKGGKGGSGGEPGEGGRILRGELSLTDGTPIRFQCGVGGEGAEYNADAPDAPGSYGTDTTFGTASTADGKSSDIGYTDIVTGEVFAQKGLDGIAGGNGVGYEGDISSSDNIGEFDPVDDVVDEDGNVWTCGAMNIADDMGSHVEGYGDSKSFTGDLDEGGAGAFFSTGLGSGAAAGANGTKDAAGKYSVYLSSDKKTITARAWASSGAKGADATLKPKKATDGRGGRGGYGGGGGASIGYAGYYTYIGSKPTAGSYNTAVYTASPGDGGLPGPGADGADGLIILLYRKPKPVSSGAVATKDGRWLLDKLGRRIIV